MAAGVPRMEFIHPKRYPQSGPRPRLRYTYCPPAAGRAAPSSARQSVPQRTTTLPMSQVVRTSPVDPAARAIGLATRKTPVPMIVLTTTKVACHGPRPRTRSGDGSPCEPGRERSLAMSPSLITIRRCNCNGPAAALGRCRRDGRSGTLHARQARTPETSEPATPLSPDVVVDRRDLPHQAFVCQAPRQRRTPIPPAPPCHIRPVLAPGALGGRGVITECTQQVRTAVCARRGAVSDLLLALGETAQRV